MDDGDYIVEFAKYIKEKEVENEYELFDYVLEFLRDYFGEIKTIERSEMFQMILKDEKTFYPAIQEHMLSDFRKKGNAMCSEYATAAQNILSVFGFDMGLVIGQEQTDGYKEETHAFNLVSFKERKSKEEIYLLLDFAGYINVYNEKFEIIDKSPFLLFMPELTDEMMIKILYQKENISGEDYAYYVIGDTTLKLGANRKRNYQCYNYRGF